MDDEKTRIREVLFKKLIELARKEPIPAIGKGDTAVGMTLLDALGIQYTSSTKPNFQGIVITAYRRVPIGIMNRVNLFAQVPDWNLSACKSSREIVTRYGYKTGPNQRRLYCTVNSQHINPQGLILEIDQGQDLMFEIAQVAKEHVPVATWKLSRLKKRLAETHPETLWVKAVVFERNGKECFHYREVIFSGLPKVDEFVGLLEAGTITMDHEIRLDENCAREKGPLFKINPSNLELLFPAPKKYDLMTM